MQVDAQLVIDALRRQVADLSYRLAVAEAVNDQYGHGRENGEDTDSPEGSA